MDKTTPRSRFATPKVTETNITVGSAIYDKYTRDRYDYDRQKLIADSLKAYRLNPLARRIVKIYRQFSIGNNVTVEIDNSKKTFAKAKAKSPRATTFIQEFWSHPINNLDEQIPEWFDERTLTGNLFILFSVDASGMPLVRALPTEEITAVLTRDNDYRQETAYKTGDLSDEIIYKAYNPAGDITPPFVRHYVINRPVGSTWGESDMYPLLPWIARFNGLLENRASLNYYRSLFAWVLTGNFTSEADRAAREKELAARPPTPNTILVKSINETWETLNPQLDSYDAQADILAIKKNIATGAGIPLHYLAEPESSTRTTAEAAGTPTFKNFQDYQQSFFNLLRDILTIACRIRRTYDSSVPADPQFEISGADISERDNSVLALALQRSYEPLSDMYDRKMIDTRELLRLAYNFAGQTYDEENTQSEGLRKPLSNKSKNQLPNPPSPPTDPDTGETVGKDD